jgi:twitching motility protein PilT
VETASPLDALLAYALRAGASDVHLRADAPAAMRVNGALAPIADAPPLSARALEAVVSALLADAPERQRELAQAGETDVAFERAGIGRFRVSLFHGRGRIGVVMRVVPAQVLSLEQLGLPPAVAVLAGAERGIVFVTGTTGSGKSTTLAAMVDRINRAAHRHVLTIEDPIELVHADRNSIITQREVGPDTASFATALRRALRQDPDVIMIGEIRDAETMEAALQAAETGHLVFSTLHTLDAAETVNRAIGFFPLHQQDAVRAMLAGTLRGIISQRLVRTADGVSRVPACEVLVATPRARDMVLSADETHRLIEVIREGEYYGMQSFDQSLFDHVSAGRVSLEAALEAASSPHDLRLMLDAGAARRREVLTG